MSEKSEEKRDRKKGMQERAKSFFDHEFVLQRVVPLVAELSNGTSPTEWVGETVRAKSSRRVTMRYVWGHGVIVYGKWYGDDPGNRGGESYRTHENMWRMGFGAGTPYRVAEPLAYLADEHFMLIRNAGGVSLASIMAEAPLEEAIRSVRGAARWLAKLHSSQLPALPEELPCERIKILKVADLLARVAAEHPERAPMLLDVMRDLRRVAPTSNAPSRLSPTHGQYRPPHIYVNGDDVIGIDLDRIWLSDPSKDVAMFMYKVKSDEFKSGNVGRGQRLANEFFEEYKAIAPENLENVSYFGALYCLKGLGKLLKSEKPDEPVDKAAEALFMAEFQRCTQQGSGSIAA